MAKLLGGEQAVIPMEKLIDYCLNQAHTRGKEKARVFASVLGITQDNASDLAHLIRQAAIAGEVTKEKSPIFGQYYRVD